eukprot:9740108-Alexandrium_andersonii.AAC.1
MSASLVGSEMCIRDSLCSVPSSTLVSCAPPDSESARERRHSVCRQRERAVSYTHLTLPTICSV